MIMKKHSAHRIYLPQTLDAIGDITIIEADKIHYIRNVLRFKLDDVLRCFNEIDGEFVAKITLCDKKEIKLTILSDNASIKPVNLPNLSIAPALIKNDKFADMIDMAVQSGATAIHPVITQNTVHRKINQDRIGRVIVEATEQSERFKPAKLHGALHLREMDFTQYDYVIYANEKEGADSKIDPEILTSANILLLTGPEGGFTPDELDFLGYLSNSHSISLGSSILRAETAMIRLISYVDMARRL